MEKVRNVGENYELNKFRTLNKTIELDARLANERLLATKFRLNDVSSMNDKLTRELNALQSQYRAQEKKLLVAETMLRQALSNQNHLQTSSTQQALASLATTSVQSVNPGEVRRAHKQTQLDAYDQKHGSRGRKASGSRRAQKSTAGYKARRLRVSPSRELAKNPATSAYHDISNGGEHCNDDESAVLQSRRRLSRRSNVSLPDTTNLDTSGQAQLMQQNLQQQQQQQQQRQKLGLSMALDRATQTTKNSQFSRTKMIIDDLRRRLNLVARSKSSGE